MKKEEILNLAPALAQTLAQTLDQATLDVREIERLTIPHPELNLTQAYAIQDQGIKLRFARGEKQVGLKMGLTSQAKREQVGLNSPIYGVLTDRMRVADGAQFSLQNSIHPKIEPEIAFLIGKDLEGQVSFEQALSACEGVCAAMEILDSRFLNFKYFSLPDVVADNCSSSYFVLGSKMHKPTSLDLAKAEIRMEINGQLAQSAQGAAISGHPVHSLMQLCALLHERGLKLKAGSIVLAGAATQAVTLEPGFQVCTHIEGLGSVALNCVE